jgi:hypothetical protein
VASKCILIFSPKNLTSPHLTSPHLTSPHLTSPHLTSPHLTSPHLTSPHLTSPHLTSPHLTSPNLISSYLISSHLISSHLTLPCSCINSILPEHSWCTFPRTQRRGLAWGCSPDIATRGWPGSGGTHRTTPDRRSRKRIRRQLTKETGFLAKTCTIFKKINWEKGHLVAASKLYFSENAIRSLTK